MFQRNVKLLKQSESGFKRTTNWNEYQSRKTNQVQKRYLDLFNLNFQGVNRLFVWSFKKKEHRESYKRYYLPTEEIKT